MKKKVKISVIVVAAVLVAVAVAILVLSLVKINPLERLPGNYTVDVYAPSSTDRMASNDETAAAVKKGIADSEYSIMHAMLEYRFDYSFSFKMKKNEDTDKMERVKLKASDINAYTATADAYLIELKYSAPVTVKVEKETVTFDRVKMLVKDMSGEIEKVELILYESGKIMGEPADEYYYATPVEVWMATSKLHTVLGTLSDML